MKTRSIARKFGIWLVLMTFLAMVVFGVINYFLFVDQLQRDLDVRLRNSAEKAADLFALHVWNLDDRSVQEVAQEQSFLKSFAVLRVFDSFGNLLYETQRPAEEREFAFTKQDIVYEGSVAGSVVVALSTESIGAAKSGVIRSTLVIIFAATLTVLGLALFIARSISRPLVSLTQTAREIAEGNLTSRVAIGSKDEIGELGNMFNAMTGQLQKSQDQLKNQVEELKELDRLKDNFLNNTTHELKTPLIPIKSQTQLLLAEDYGTLNEGQKKAVQMISRNETHLENLVNDIVDITKIRSGNLNVHHQDTDPTQIITNAVLDMEEPANEKGLVLTLEPIPELPTFSLDRKLITQVIGNLLNNALKFTPKGGEVTVKVSSRGGPATDGKNTAMEVVISVKDTGIGMSKKTLEKLFTSFFQADSDAARKYGGSGLGLSICKGIVEAHGGTIWAESDGEEKGTTIVFTLPRPNKG